MQGALTSRLGIVLAIVLLVATVLAGQAAADSLTPQGVSTDTGRTLGRAGFAYLTGLRTFAAAVLWNRIEPVFHDYYEGVALEEQTYMLPTARAVVALDPQLQQPYYVTAWMLARRGAVAEGLELARLGVENNPESGLMRANYVQIAFLFSEDRAEAALQAKRALEDDIVWRDLIEQYEAYAILRDVLSANGEAGLAAEVSTRMRIIDDEIHRLGLDVGDDHEH